MRLGEVRGEDCQNVDDLLFDDLISKGHETLGQDETCLVRRLGDRERVDNLFLEPAIAELSQ